MKKTKIDRSIDTEALGFQVRESYKTARSNMDSLERSSDGFGGIAPYVIALRFSIFVSFTISSSEHSSLR